MRCYNFFSISINICLSVSFSCRCWVEAVAVEMLKVVESWMMIFFFLKKQATEEQKQAEASTSEASARSDIFAFFQLKLKLLLLSNSITALFMSDSLKLRHCYVGVVMVFSELKFSAANNVTSSPNHRLSNHTTPHSHIYACLNNNVDFFEIS